MRKLLLILTVVLTFAACNKDDDYTFRSGEFVYLPFKGQSEQIASNDSKRGTMCYSNYSGKTWTAHELVRRNDVCLWCNYNSVRWFWDELRDTVNDMLLWRAEDIIRVPDGALVEDFLYNMKDCMIVVGKDANIEFRHNVQKLEVDTVGYIPNATIIEARKHIEELYEAEKYDEIYEYFHHAFEIIPCTGSEYKALVEQGLQ